MVEKNILLAKAYYQAMNEKDLASVEKYWHPEALLINPFGETKGKGAILPIVIGFMNSFDALTIRASFGSQDQAMLVVDLNYPLPIGIARTAVLMTFKDDLIVRSELFFDTRQFTQK